MAKRSPKLVKLAKVSVFDSNRQKDLDFYVPVDSLDDFKQTQSYVIKVKMASQIVDPVSKQYLKNEFKNNPASVHIEVV